MAAAPNLRPAQPSPAVLVKNIYGRGFPSPHLLQKKVNKPLAKQTSGIFIKQSSKFGWKACFSQGELTSPARHLHQSQGTRSRSDCGSGASPAKARKRPGGKRRWGWRLKKEKRFVKSVAFNPWLCHGKAAAEERQGDGCSAALEKQRRAAELLPRNVILREN